MPSSLFQRIRKAIREHAAKRLQNCPPLYKSLGVSPVCTEEDFQWFAGTASSRTTIAPFPLKEGAPQELIMSGTIDAFQSTMEEAFASIRIRYLAFDSAEFGLLMTAMTAALVGLRSYALNWCFCPYDPSVDPQEEAERAGIDAGKAAIASLRELRNRPIPQSEEAAVLRRVATKAATEAAKHISLDKAPLDENTLRFRTITHTADALAAGIRAGIEAGFPYDKSTAVVTAAVTATVSICHASVVLLSTGDRWSRANPSMARAEDQAIDAGVKSGKRVLQRARDFENGY
ncbi:hypothetical protein F4861DRAFT_507426 [Xylaria intraflava]|nr:hypothetical protein F4861DRAFT_507426 [Xylaria intraflava]